MLPLNDPLWTKLDDAHRDRDIPQLLSRLAKSWDDKEANSLFWDCLCHQETCYGATYAAIPHLLAIAQPHANHHQRLEIAIFLGCVTLAGLGRGYTFDGKPEINSPHGLPHTLDAWDQKLDVYRSLLAILEDPTQTRTDFERSHLSRYRSILAIGPVNSDDLAKIEAIRSDFFAALPAIKDLCERALLENLDHEAVSYLLSGMAAADQLTDLAWLLSCGAEGTFRCSSCDQPYEYLTFAHRVAIYAEDRTPPRPASRPMAEDRSLQDFREGAPSRCDGSIVPVGDENIVDPRVTSLLALAERAKSQQPALLLRHFLGSFVCCACGARGPICAP